MITARSFTLIIASALGISLVLMPLGYAAEGIRGATLTTAVQTHNVTVVHRGTVTQQRRKPHRHLRMATQTHVQRVR